MNELLPCPFCGGEAILESNKLRYGTLYSVYCQKCGAEITRFPEHEAVAAWNSRTGKDINVLTNNAAPAVQGEWIRMDETQALLSVEWKCSQCGQEIRVDGILTAIGAGWKYCPNCGARMDKEDTNATD